MLYNTYFRTENMLMLRTITVKTGFQNTKKWKAVVLYVLVES